MTERIGWRGLTEGIGGENRGRNWRRELAERIGREDWVERIGREDWVQRIRLRELMEGLGGEDWRSELIERIKEIIGGENWLIGLGGEDWRSELIERIKERIGERIDRENRRRELANRIGWRGLAKGNVLNKLLMQCTQKSYKVYDVIYDRVFHIYDVIYENTHPRN